MIQNQHFVKVFRFFMAGQVPTKLGRLPNSLWITLLAPCDSERHEEFEAPPFVETLKKSDWNDFFIRAHVPSAGAISLSNQRSYRSPKTQFLLVHAVRLKPLQLAMNRKEPFFISNCASSISII